MACSSEPTQNPGGGGGSGGGAGGSGNAAGAGGGSGKLDRTKFIILSGPSAALGATPAPASYTKNCINCHANAGQGVTGLAPEIRHAPLTYFNYVTRAGRDGSLMVPFPVSTVSDADMSAIHTWLAGLPKPTTGDQLYLDYCGNCHGPDALGSVIPLGVRGGKKADTTQLVRMGHGTDPSIRGQYMPAQGTEQLSDAELGLIADFLGAM
ncbi:MAG TPA: c-type cytochrome [Polyangiaceae bacterium]|nr:c-type cytochrome [Polyangiaceae bacterium]